MPLYHHPLSIDELIDQNVTQPLHQHGHQMYSHDHIASTTPQIYSGAPIWPLTDPSEALLLRHFVQNLAIWVGYTDPVQAFVELILNPLYSWTFAILSSISKPMFHREQEHAGFC